MLAVTKWIFIHLVKLVARGHVRAVSVRGGVDDGSSFEIQGGV